MGYSQHEGKGIEFRDQVNRKTRRLLSRFPRFAEAIVAQCPTIRAARKEKGAILQTHVSDLIDRLESSIATIGGAGAWGLIGFFHLLWGREAVLEKKSGREALFPSGGVPGGTRGGWGRGPAARRKKPPPVPLSALLRTRIDQGVPQPRFLDPTATVGLQAPDALLAPSGYSIGSSKATPVHEHRRGL